MDELLEARISNLEAQVQFLLRINGLDLSELKMASDEVLLEYYQNVVQLLAVAPARMPPETVETWSELFLQVSEVEFVRLARIVNYVHTWEPFYQLCVRMMTSVRQNPEFAEVVQLQHLYAVLDRGRRNLRDAAVLIVQKHPQDLSPRAKALLFGDDLSQYLRK